MNEQKEAIKQTVLKLADRSASSPAYRAALLAQLRTVVPFDAACCTTVDPQTLLSTGAVTEERVEAIHSGLFEYEFLRKDFIPYRELVKAVAPVATLSQATEGCLERSARYRNVLRPAGFQDELRAALMYKGACWGCMTLSAKPADTLALIAEAYGLSEREKQILDQVVRAASTKEIAQELHISSYTVQDHLKSIFAKTGVASRRELLWQLFSRYSVG